jgi:4-aminobutyrate aminotransferase / (S)-3-amino-2-methylpropionate transaminase / 5-aminovalerate transaminase
VKGELPRIVVKPPGPRSRELAARLSAVESPAFDARRTSRAATSGEEQTPIVYAWGEGSNVTDVDNNRYVDLTCGFGALALGHNPKGPTKAALAQADRLTLALGDVYASEAKTVLCERLAAIYPEAGARVMLGLSGADALTAALKTCLLKTGKAGVVAFEGAYHGLSYGPLAACGYSAAFRAPFAAQLGDHVRFVPYPAAGDDLDACKMHVTNALAAGDVGAVLVEPVLGRGGCVVPPAGFLAMLRAACDDSGALLVCDEVWTGLGRSGAVARSLAEGVRADVLCFGKSLGAGWPVSACVGSAAAMAAWGAHGGTAIHTATHFGAPPACAAANAYLDALSASSLDARARTVGDAWRQELRAATAGRGVREVRGVGLMVGVALDGGSPRALATSRRLLEAGFVVLTGAVGGDVLTLTPALDVPADLLRAFTVALAAAL